MTLGAMQWNTGSGNTAVGISALSENDEPVLHTLPQLEIWHSIGLQDLETPQLEQWGLGSSGSNPVSGDGNTGVGIYALEAVTSGSYNTAIGYRSGGNLGGIR